MKTEQQRKNEQELMAEHPDYSKRYPIESKAAKAWKPLDGEVLR